MLRYNSTDDYYYYLLLFIYLRLAFLDHLKLFSMKSYSVRIVFDSFVNSRREDKEDCTLHAT